MNTGIVRNLCRTVLCAFILTGVATAAYAVKASDYVGMSGQYDYYRERLASQIRMVEGDLAYVREAEAQFSAKANTLLERARKLRGAAQECRNSLANGTLTICTVRSRGQKISISEAENLAAEYERRSQTCPGFSGEASLDARALSDRIREATTLRNDLEQWKGMNDEAITDQLKTVAGAVFGEFASYLARQTKEVAVLNKVINKYRTKLANGRVDLPKIEAKLLEANSLYLRAKLTLETAKAVKATDPVSLYSLLENTILLIAEVESTTLDSVKAAMDDPEIGALLKKENVGWDVLGGIYQPVAGTVMDNKKVREFLGMSKGYKLAPAIGIAALVVDSSYNIKKWIESLDQITSRFELAEKSKTAAQALHALVERRKARWGQCLDY